jgi:general secretion pathway protein F
MPLYQYTGLSQTGKNVSGTLEAENLRLLKDALKQKGIFLSEAKEKARARRVESTAATKATTAAKATAATSLATKNIELSDFVPAFFKSIPLASIATMTKLLSVLLSAQIPLVESLSALVDQVDNPRLREVLIEVRDQVNEGSSFADALKNTGVFSDLYINMIRAGEASGTLDLVLVRLSEFTENQLKVRGKVSGALAYPALMMMVGGGILFLLMTTVVPQLTRIFQDMDARLPWYTELLIWSSNFLSSYWLLMFLGVGGGLFFWLRHIKTPEGKLMFHRLQLQLPLLGQVIRLFSISRFAKTLATLRSSNVELLTALGIARNVMGNEVLAQVIDKTRDAVREGESLAAPLRRSGHFPPLVSHMIAIGEKAGRLEEMLENIASAYESQADGRVQKVTSLLEPMMIVIMGVSVGFVVFAILMPIMQLNQLM